MKFGISEMGFPYDDIDRSLERISEAGYDGIELQIGNERLEQPDEIARIRDSAAEHGLEIPSIIAAAAQGTPLSHPDTEVRTDCIATATELIDEIATGVLDVDTVLFIPGRVSEDLSYDTAYEYSQSSVRELASVCAENDVSIGIENVWNKFLLSPLEFASFIDETADAGPVGAYYDVGNTMKHGYPDQWIDILGDRIEKVHVKDYDTDINNARGFTYPTQGDVPWESVAAALDVIGYDDWVTLEVSPYPTHGEHMPSQVLENLRTTFE